MLIVDLDETLIHATETPLERLADFRYSDYFIYKRPYVETFLETISPYFDLAIWSSADDRYVKDIINSIKPLSINFKFVWGRSRCTTTRNYELDKYVHEKRLKKVKKQGYTLEKMLIIDDSPEKTRENYGNAIYIDPFEGDQADHELTLVQKYLLSIKDVTHVRSFEKRGWRNRVLTDL